MEITKLKLDYNAIEPDAKRFQAALSAELNHLITKGEVTLGVPIESRVKEWASIEEKIKRKSLTLSKIQDIDDLVGIRLILLFRRDLTTVDELLRSALDIKSSEDTSLRLADTQFGYQSQHYIIEAPSSWLNMPSWREFGGIRVEIQVRTLAQHIWAAASHKLQYKHEASVPLPLRRSINRASALLETVDIEFDRLLEDRLLYVADQMKLEDPDTPLNVEVLRALLSDIFPKRNASNDESYDELLAELNLTSIKTKKQLESLIRKHQDKILAKDTEFANKPGGNGLHYFNLVGLGRQALRFEFGNKEFESIMRSRKTKKI